MLRTTLPFTASVTASVVSFETTRSWAYPVGAGEQAATRRKPKSVAFALVRDVDVQEDALVLHPRNGVDHGPQVDRVEPRSHWRAHLEGERSDPSRHDRGFGLGRDAVRGQPVDAERRPLRVVLVHGEAS